MCPEWKIGGGGVRSFEDGGALIEMAWSEGRVAWQGHGWLWLRRGGG